MNASRFDTVIRALAGPPSRRGLLRMFAGILGLHAGLGYAAVAAKKKRQKPKKAKPNAFGCLDVGKPCRGKDARCCSGVCQGKRPKKGKRDRSRCVAHNVGGCQPDEDFCQGVVVNCGTGSGACQRTTGKVSYCGVGFICLDCKKDRDCDELGLGPGAACIVCGEPECPAPLRTACSSAA